MFFEIHMVCSLLAVSVMTKILQDYNRWYPLLFIGYNFVLMPAQYYHGKNTSTVMQFVWVVFLLQASRRIPRVLTPREYTSTVLLLLCSAVNSFVRNCF